MEDLQDLLREIRDCRACAQEFPHEPRPVVQVSAEVKVLVCGQAPGRRVHESGIPFDDPSGDRLRSWMGVDKAQFYGDERIGVAAMAFCYPGTAPGGGDYPPPARCAKLWRERLVAQLPKVELTILVGGYAQRWALGAHAKRGVSATVKAWRLFLPEIVALPHPSWRTRAWLARRPWITEEIVPYLQQRVAEALAG